MPSPMATPLPRFSRTGKDTTTSRLFATLTSLSPTLQVMPLCQRGTTRLQHRSLLHTEMEPSMWPVFASSHRRRRLRQAYGNLLLSLCERSQPQRQPSLEGTVSLRLWRKGNCEAQTSWCCLEAELETCAKVQAMVPTHLDMAMSRMS